MGKYILVIWLFLVTGNFSLAEPVNELCPVTTDERIDESITTIYKGNEIGFCCKKCLRKFNADPTEYIKNLDHLEDAHSMVALPEGDGHDHEHGDQDNSNAATAAVHDHSTDHSGNGPGLVTRLKMLLGKLHVMVIHFPIALLALATLFELIAWNERPKWLFAARLNFILGASAAIVAAILGWILASQGSYVGELDEILSWHRWLGITVSLMAVCGLLALVAEKLDCDWGKPLYRILLFGLAIVVPIAAHYGGSLVYGAGYFSF